MSVNKEVKCENGINEERMKIEHLEKKEMTN